MEKAKILLVDDDDLFRGVVLKMLNRFGYEGVCEASSGKEALGLVQEISPDLVLMDIELPDMDGILTAALILESYPGAKIVMMTGMGTPTRVTDSIRAGAKNIMFKPFEVTQLKAVVRKALGS